MHPTYELWQGDCLDVLASIASASVDCVVSDPPYPEIVRDYGRMSEADWLVMMQAAVRHTRRILKPTGSAVFILQPNSKKVGQMRPWLYEFQAWCCREWNIVQDAYWWNTCAMPKGVAQFGLLRPSVKPCLWLGPPNCYRDQGRVLWSESARNHEMRVTGQAKDELITQPSTTGGPTNRHRMAKAAVARGGVTPFNLLPMPNANSSNSAGSHGHGAGTPSALTDWWVRYLCPPGGVVADWFCGTGTSGLSAAHYGNSFIGIEKMENYYQVSRTRLEAAYRQPQTLPLEVCP